MLLRVQDDKTGGVDLWVLPLDEGPVTSGQFPAKARPLVATDPDEFINGSISPDGKWLQYISNESGRREVYVVPFPELGEKRQVSTGGAITGRWLGDKAIMYSQPPDGKLFAVDLEANGTSLRVGAPRAIFGGKPAPRGAFDVTLDGKRFLFAVPIEDRASAQVRFVSDWRAELGRSDVASASLRGLRLRRTGERLAQRGSTVRLASALRCGSRDANLLPPFGRETICVAS